MYGYKQTLLILTAIALGSTTIASSANAEPTVYQNNDRNVYIFHPDDSNYQTPSVEKTVYYGSQVDYYKGPVRTGYDGPNANYYRGPKRTIYNGAKADYYRGPRGVVIKGANRTYIKPGR
jgi:hypothetical protein